MSGPSGPESAGGWSAGGWSEAPAPAAGEPAPAAGDPAPPAAAPGGRYEVGACLGRGGMGVVHAARDAVLGRDVALKTLPADRALDAAAGARLAREAAITSRLDHPGIVPVLDIGRTPDGRGFYTMRLVRGGSLDQALRAGGCTPVAGARHVLAAAEAVAAAHAAGIVHRDLKPANLLIGPHGETQVADWGLAVPAEGEAGRWTGLPEARLEGPVGTPGFVSPEQQAGAPPRRTDDVFSLGRTLAAVAGGAGGQELQAIIDKATASPPGARYPDAAALAADLLAWFEGRRVAAHDYSARELLLRALRAWRAPLGVGAVAVVVVLTVAFVGWSDASGARDRAETAEREAAWALADLRLDEAVAATQAGDRARAERLAAAVLAHREDPGARGVLAAFGRAGRPRLEAHTPLPSCSWRAIGPAGAWTLCGHGDAVSRLDAAGRLDWSTPVGGPAGGVAPEGVLLRDNAGHLVHLDAASGAPRGRWTREVGDVLARGGVRYLWGGQGPVSVPESTCASPEAAALSGGGRVALLCGDGGVHVGPRGGALSAWRRFPTEATGDHVGTALSWTPDGAGLLVGTVRGRILRLDAETGAQVGAVQTDLGVIVALHPAPVRGHVAVRGSRGGVGVWMRGAGDALMELPAERAADLAWRGDRLLVADARGLQRWALPAGAPTRIRVDRGLSGLHVDPAAGRLALSGSGGRVVLVDLASGATTGLRFGEGVVKAAIPGPLGLLATGMDGPVLAWATDTGWRPLADPIPLRRAAVRADGTVVGLHMDDGVVAWDPGGGERRTLAAGGGFVDLSQDGDRVFVLAATGEILAVGPDAATPVGRGDGARALAVRGACTAVGGDAGVSVDCGDGPRALTADGDRVLSLAWSADGGLLAAGTLLGPVHLWSWPDGELRAVLPGHADRVVGLGFLPDGGLATASWDRTARLYDLSALRSPRAAAVAVVTAAWRDGTPPLP